MKKLCITGGAGFVGSNMVEFFAKRYPHTEILVVDKLTYAGHMRNLSAVLDGERVRHAKVCVTDEASMTDLLRGVDVVIHAAAESHVDRSYLHVGDFIQSNVVGTVAVARACMTNGCQLIHISTDEVYGEASHRDFDDNSVLQPTNPYAASKAAAELFLHAYQKSFPLDVTMVRPNNMYGIRQYPEKLIPKLILCILFGRRFPLHGSGMARRSFLHTEDFCEALVTILESCVPGHVYNIPSDDELSVRAVIDLVCQTMGADPSSLVEPGPDRPYQDNRYGIIGDKLFALGWRQRRRLRDDMPELVAWYRMNADRYAAAFDAPKDSDRERFA